MKYRKNTRECSVQVDLLDSGFEIVTRGWPTFLAIRGDEIKAVVVKKKQKRDTMKMGLSSYQKRMHEILRGIGIEVEVRYLD